MEGSTILRGAIRELSADLGPITPTIGIAPPRIDPYGAPEMRASATTATAAVGTWPTNPPTRVPRKPRRDGRAGGTRLDQHRRAASAYILLEPIADAHPETPLRDHAAGGASASGSTPSTTGTD